MGERTLMERQDSHREIALTLVEVVKGRPRRTPTDAERLQMALIEAIVYVGDQMRRCADLLDQAWAEDHGPPVT